jgi:hypothetical protein
VTTASHVIEWMPPRMIKGRGPGFWQIRTIADFNAPVSDEPLDDFDAPRDAGPGQIATLAAARLGFDVTLEAGEQELRAARFGGRWSTEPLYYARRTS